MKDWFWARVAATEGDLTVGCSMLNTIAESIAKDYLESGVILNYSTATYYCNKYGVNYDSLLAEEKDYLDRKVEELIN